MAPQSPLEESATTEASRMWHENGRVRWSYCSKNPFIECSFHEITIEFLLELVQKTSEKKTRNKQTDRHADRIQPISSSAVAMFWTVHTQIPFANASKTCPQSDPRIPVNHLKSISGKKNPVFEQQDAITPQKIFRNRGVF